MRQFVTALPLLSGAVSWQVLVAHVVSSGAPVEETGAPALCGIAVKSLVKPEIHIPAQKNSKTILTLIVCYVCEESRQTYTKYNKYSTIKDIPFLRYG